MRDGFDQLPEYEHRLFMTDEIGLICSQESDWHSCRNLIFRCCGMKKSF